MKDTDLLGVGCAGDSECCGQGREEIFFPEGPAFVVFPAPRVSHSPGKAKKDQMPRDAHLRVYGMLSKGEFISGQHAEASELLPVRDLRCRGSLGALGQSCRGQPGRRGLGRRKASSGTKTWALG